MPISIVAIQTAADASEKIGKEQLDQASKAINDILESHAEGWRPEITWLQSSGQNFTRLTAIIRW